MNIAVFIKRTLALVMLAQALWLTACIEEEEGRLIKTILIQNIPSSLEITQEAATQINSKNNPYVNIDQETGKWYIKTDGLIMLAAFLPTDAAAAEAKAILEDGAPSQKILDYGAAFAQMTISGGTATGRLLTLSAKANEVGYYWEGDSSGDEYNICLLLLTPDARFILRVDVSTESYLGTMSEYTLRYDSVFEIPDVSSINDILDFIKGTTTTPEDITTVFQIKKGASPADHDEAEELLPDDFVDDLFNRFS